MSEKKSKLAWLTLGLGFSPGTFDTPGSGALDICIVSSFSYKNNIYSFRFIDIYDFNMEYDSENIMDFSLLYGKKKIFNDGTAFLSIAIGPGLIKGHRHGKSTDCCSHEKIPFQTLGLSFETQAFVTSRYVGFGTYLFANVNNEWNVYGFLFCLQFGKLK